MYGLRTVLSGTLLPARPIALAFPEVMRDLKRSGFEVGVHGYDHVRWQDQLDPSVTTAFERTRGSVRGIPRDHRQSCAQLRRARMAHQRFGAARARRGEPRVSQRHARAQSLSMHRRGPHPQDHRDSHHAADARRGDGSAGDSRWRRRDSILSRAISRTTRSTSTPSTPRPRGWASSKCSPRWCARLKERGAEFVRLEEVASKLNLDGAADLSCDSRDLPGRAGWISAQGPEVASAQS